MRFLACFVLAVSFPLAACDDAAAEAEIEAAFVAAKAKHVAEVEKLQRLAILRKATKKQVDQLRKLRQQTTVMPEIEFKVGSMGPVVVTFREAITGNRSHATEAYMDYAIIDNRPVPRPGSVAVILENFDNTKLAPRETISTTVYIARFEGETAVYRYIDLAPYAAKFGKLK